MGRESIFEWFALIVKMRRTVEDGDEDCIIFEL